MSSCGEVPGVELINVRPLSSFLAYIILFAKLKVKQTHLFSLFFVVAFVVVLLLFDVESLKLYLRRNTQKPYRPNYTQTPVSVEIVSLRK